ncbi:hypothetical protein PoB_007404900 [Plakobranchus ocellatus]|uniref:Uncharacterized protein n=1 Tax=Plakobranchus ocellatus TaxID=259542 RepID=A0AAV4DTI7_9GAST|nr:hypothetical protein PoB_007404900 [Plakobranchus ocellatus]
MGDLEVAALIGLNVLVAVEHRTGRFPAPPVQVWLTTKPPGTQSEQCLIKPYQTGKPEINTSTQGTGRSNESFYQATILSFRQLNAKSIC